MNFELLYRVAYTVGVWCLALTVLPLMLCIALCKFLADGTPVIFTQKRIGKNSVPFEMYKFRTMGNDAEAKKRLLLTANEADGPVFKIRNDPRHTRFGRFLAHTGLDELPQLWNVLRGDMSLIGPRPLPVDEVRNIPHKYYLRHAITPGIISPWILDGYHTQTFDAWMKSDLTYISRKSLAYDLKLSARALLFLLRLLVAEFGNRSV